MDRKLGRERRLLERIGLGARAFRRDVDGNHVLAALEQRFKHCFAECLLAVNNYSHKLTPQNPLMPTKAGVQNTL
jgi:hypothetical protein